MKYNKLDDIITSLKVSIANSDIEINPNTLFEKAVDIFIHESEEENKDKRTIQIQESKEIDINKPTPKQLSMLKRLGFNGNFNTITKQEASMAIKEYLENQKKEKDDESYY